MLSDAKIRSYREMTPEERWLETEELMTLAWRFLLELPPKERERRLRVSRQQHEHSDAIVLDHLRRFA